MREVDNSQDFLDSRDIIARINELESDRQYLEDAVTDAEETLTDLSDDTSAESSAEGTAEARQALEDAKQALADWEDADELKSLQAFAEEAEGYASDWRHGCTLIRDSYFTQYAQELAEDIGAVGRDMQWPLQHIDWEGAAEELKIDYSGIEFDGVTYWVR